MVRLTPKQEAGQVGKTRHKRSHGGKEFIVSGFLTIVYILDFLRFRANLSRLVQKHLRPRHRSQSRSELIVLGRRRRRRLR
jgi:hypothetical protein